MIAAYSKTDCSLRKQRFDCDKNIPRPLYNILY